MRWSVASNAKIDVTSAAKPCHCAFAQRHLRIRWNKSTAATVAQGGLFLIDSCRFSHTHITTVTRAAA
jgi:hypothetical protein